MRLLRTSLRQHLSSCSGFMLLTALMMAGILSFLGLTFMARVSYEPQHAGHWKQSTQAFYLAEAAVNQGVSLLQQQDAIVQLPYHQSEMTMGQGNYSLSIEQAQDSSSLPLYGLKGIGRVGNVTRVSQLWLAREPFQPPTAILTAGTLTVSGNPTIQGSMGSIHSNRDLLLSGSPHIQENATSSEGYGASRSATVGGYSGGNQPQMKLPQVDPTMYQGDANYVLRGDGTVTDSLGTILATGGSWNNWSFSNNTWSFNDTNVTDGTYYIEGNVSISGSPGSSTDPWQVTLVATGSVSIVGSPVLKPYLSDILVVAGGDLQIFGTTQMSMAGFFLVHEQIEIAGNTTILGAIIAENATDVYPEIHKNTIPGNPMIQYDGYLDTQRMPKQLVLRSWHRT